MRVIGDGGRDSNNPFHSEISERGSTGSGWDGVHFYPPIWHCMLGWWLRVLITHWHLAEQCLHSTKVSSFSYPAPPLSSPAAGWGWTRSWKGTQLGQLSWTKDAPYPTASCSATKTVRQEERSWGFWLPRWPLLREWASLCFWKLVSDWICSTSRDFSPLLHLLICLYLNCQEFSWVYSSHSLPCTPGGGKRSE